MKVKHLKVQSFVPSLRKMFWHCFYWIPLQSPYWGSADCCRSPGWQWAHSQNPQLHQVQQLGQSTRPKHDRSQPQLQLFCYFLCCSHLSLFWSQIQSWIASVSSSNPNLISRQVIGNTYEGRPMNVLKVLFQDLHSVLFVTRRIIPSDTRFTMTLNNYSSVRSPAPQSPPSSWTAASTPESGSPLLSASGLWRR